MGSLRDKPKIVVERYDAALHRAAWNELVRLSVSHSFLFERNYMDYHADRFRDCSLVFQHKNKIVGLLPACIGPDGKTVVSHAGLTYGGLIRKASATTLLVIAMLDEAFLWYQSAGFEVLIYKPMPHIYASYPSEADLYWLFSRKARLTERGCSSAVDVWQPLPLSTLRKRRLKDTSHAPGFREYAVSHTQNFQEYSYSTDDALMGRFGLRQKQLLWLHTLTRDYKQWAQNSFGLHLRKTIQESDYQKFWDILTETLMERHGVSPVHTLEEILGLAARFPENINLYVAERRDGGMYGGTLLYTSRNVCHAQYIAATEEGRRGGALDHLFFALIQQLSLSKGSPRYFDFGISTERDSSLLNEGLIFQKEGFGARAVCYDWYEVALK